MIPKAYIEQWRKSAPWRDDAQIEQDLVLSRALVEIFSNNRLSKTMRFRGGTALYKLFFKSTSRYSEDLDFVQAAPGPIGEDIDALREVLDPWLGEPKRKRGPGIVTLIYRFQSEIENIPLRLKVEMNTREHVQAYPLIKKTFGVKSEWCNKSCEIETYSLDELIGSKLRALYSRKKGRDLFDCWTALQEDAIDVSKTLGAFQHYLEYSGQSISRAEYERNLSLKLEDPLFRNDMGPLLVSGHDWDIDAAATLVSKEIIERIPGEPWKREEERDG